MIWYFLYPFRGTTEPPTLAPSHPLRRFFTQYGREAARHPVITLLISVAVAAILIYPFPYLYTNDFSSGSSNLPHHVWTAAQPFKGGPNTIPDLVMRSVWVHGSYMKALDYKVLQTALEIQDALLGPTRDFNPRLASKYLRKGASADNMTMDIRDSLHAINGLDEFAWFFHSPLLYWSCSSEMIDKDPDIIATVNKKSTKVTSVNVTLRHSNVFSGKLFEEKRLVAADALVITLLHKLDSPVGKAWERNAESLARTTDKDWRIYPSDGRVINSQLYEFRFQPLSFQDDILLGSAYGLTTIYFLLSLTKLRALKSRFGLSTAVITQISLSIMSSFTICAIFKIDLSRIPREAYPLVVLTVGLENIFRLINAVIVTPSESLTALRIAEALGQTSHIALAGVAQNLFILWLLAKVVSPGVTAFCIFAGIALTFDFLYLLSFFVAVLSVEVRRTELSDSLDRGGSRAKARMQTDVRSKHTWVDSVLRGDIPISTRISGTIVMIGFVLIAQWHFFDHENPWQTASRLSQSILVSNTPPSSTASTLSTDVNQARTPTSWLRLQDHQTAREVINVVKPDAYSYIARVFDPLVFVLEGSDRTPSRQGIRLFLPAAYDFIKHQSVQFVMTVLFIVAAVSLLMSYLLWNDEEVDFLDYKEHSKDERLLAVRTLNKGHVLDIAMLTASPEGLVISVGLDRRVRVWDIRQEIKAHMAATRDSNVDLFPILATAVDDNASWLATLSANGLIMLWSISRQKWLYSAKVEASGKSPVAFLFVSVKADPTPSVLLVRSSGIMSEIFVGSDDTLEVKDVQICNDTIVCSRQYLEAGMTSQQVLIVVSRHGSIHIATRSEDKWDFQDLNLDIPDKNQKVLLIVPLPMLKSFLAVRSDTVDLVNMETRSILQTFQTVKSRPGSVRCFYSTKRTPHFGYNGLASFSIVYTEKDSEDCILQTYTPGKEVEVLCIDYKKCPNEQAHCSWGSALMQVHRVGQPGKWESLPVGAVVGIRRSQALTSSATGYNPSESVHSSSSLRRRELTHQRPSSTVKIRDNDLWEAWMLTAKGERSSVSLSMNETNGALDGHLLVNTCGPVTRIGQRSVAVGMGNVIQVITVGQERFIIEDGLDDMALAMASRRRKPVPTRKRSYGSADRTNIPAHVS